MSTANKLSYLNDTKSLLRTSLNKFGSSILSTDTFRSYDTKLNEIYDKLPKVTATGQGLTISNVQNGLLDDFKMNGVDLEQDTTRGNQLIDFNNPSYVHSNITWSFENDVLELEGTSGKYIDIQFNILNIISDTSNVGKVIKFGFKTISNMTGSGDRVQINITYNDETARQYNILVNQYGNINSSYTIPNDVSNIKYATLNIYTNNKFTESVGSITIEKPLLYFDNNTDYEPYTEGPSPNPDYPQEIKVVEGRQVITDKGKNLFTLDNFLTRIGQPTTTGNNQEFTISGEGNYNANIYKIGKIKDFIGKTLTFKAGFVSTSIQVNTAYSFISCDSNGNNRVELSRLTLNDNNLTGTYTIPSSLDENLTLAIRLYGTSSTSGSTTYTNTQIEEGSIATDYEPYYEPVSYNIDLQLANIYLAKMPNTDYKNRIYKNNGNWYYEEKAKKVVLDGSENWSYYGDSRWKYRLVINDIVPFTNSSAGQAMPSNNLIINRFLPTYWTNDDNNGKWCGMKDINTTISFSLSSINSLSEFKAWLSTHNVIVWYPLATPVTTQITNTTLINQLEAISVYTGTNIITISNSNNIIPEIEITRLKELEKLS